jgi:4-hydroxybenzoate polyprenyltransferase
VSSRSSEDSRSGVAEVIRRYLGLIRFSHTIFALPFAMLAMLWAYIVPAQSEGLAGGAISFRWMHLIGILLCMVSARSFAMAVNRWADRYLDGSNPRTAARHLPAGLVSSRGVLGFIAASAIGFMVGCGLFWPNPIPLVAAVPVLGFLGGYSWAKRFTQLAHFWLGIGLMLAPICVWLALRGELVLSRWQDLAPALWLASVVLFWVAGFDIIYACQDYEFDRNAGLFSVPSRLGVKNALRVAQVCHGIMWLLAIAMAWVLPQLSLSWIYLTAVGIVGILLFWQHAVVSEKSLEHVNFAFFQLNSVISLVFLTVGGWDAWHR